MSSFYMDPTACEMRQFIPAPPKSPLLAFARFAHPLPASSLQGVEFWAVNTDAQALENSLAMNKVQLGGALTRGLGVHPCPGGSVRCDH